MGHHLLEEPLVPGMPPMATRLLAVGGDTAKLGCLVTNLRLRGYQVTGSTDPAAAMAGLRQDGQQGFNFDLVMVDMFSFNPRGARAAAAKLFEFTLREPLLCAYAIKGHATFGPIVMEDIDKFTKPIYTVESNGPNSQKASLNGQYNTAPSMIASTIANSSLSGRSKKPKHGTESQEVEQDGDHVEKEEKQLPQSPKKHRVVWTDELQKKFLEAYDELITAGEAPVPKKILHLMNDPTLTRAHIASHLQKHRVNLEREKCTDHKASFPSHNKVSQQQDPPTIMQPGLPATVYINYDMNAHKMLEASTKCDMQIHTQTFNATDKSNQRMPVDVPPKDMNPGADDPKQNSCVGNSDGNLLHKDLSDILEDEPNPSWDTEYLFSSGD